MSEAQHPMEETPAVAPAATEPTTVTDTAAEANADPVRPTDSSALSPESRPEVTQATAGTTAALPNLTNVPKEEKVGKGEVLIESHAINEGVLNYRGQGLKGLIPSKKYFWLRDEPLEHKHLAGYLGNEKSKDIAHPNAAHATQTGKGLMFGAKRAEDKGHPQIIYNLADVTDVAKGNFDDFTFSLHGQKHTFQATNKAERDGWLVSIESKAADAKTNREGIIGSSGYKSQLEKYGAPTAAATSGTSRSLSRHKKASKSRERKNAGAATGTTTDTSSDVPADTNTASVAGMSQAESNHNTVTGPTTGTKAEEAAAGGAAVGAVAGAGATRNGSTSEEEKSKAKKNRSRSRNKRGSIFGTLLGKKEDKEEKAEDKTLKKEIKKEEKAEKAEDKAIKAEVKKEDKAERKEEKAEDKAIKKEEKAEDKAEKKGIKEERREEKLLEKEAKHQGIGSVEGFDAAAVASRVVGEPVIPASGVSAGAANTSAEPLATESITAETTPASTTRETAPKPNKRASIFSGLFNKKDATSPAATDAAPVVPSKEEPSTVSSTAPQLENPVTSTTPVTDAANTGAAAVVPDSTAAATATTPTDKRRTSFFGTLGTKKGRSTGGTSDTELTDGEGKKQSSGGFGGLLRKASRVQGKSSSASATKDAAEVPLPKETPGAAEPTTNGETPAEKPALNEGEAGDNPVMGQTPVQLAA